MEITNKYYLSVCTTIKDEARYLQEFIEIHLMFGVEHFYIYDNDSTDNIMDVIEAYKEYITYEKVNGFCKQLPTYDKCLIDHRMQSRWIAFIDVDEHIVPIKCGNLVPILKEYEDFPGVEFNWCCFNSGLEIKYNNGLLCERFKWRNIQDSHQNRHVKTIVNPQLTECTVGHPHRFLYKNGLRAVYSDKTITTGNVNSFFDKPVIWNDVRINHYSKRSLEEYLMKIKRGTADHNKDNNIYSLDDFMNDNISVIYDPYMDLHIPRLKEQINKRGMIV
jgi:hypothetical protein